MGALASCYAALGRFEDAVLLHEKSLEFMRRVQPEKHPDIGVILYFAVDLTCFFTRLLQTTPCAVSLFRTCILIDAKMPCCCLRSPCSLVEVCCLRTTRI
jgi:hypothetical protein